MTTEKKENWKYFTILLADDGSSISKSSQQQLIEALSGKHTPRPPGVFKVVRDSDLLPFLGQSGEEQEELESPSAGQMANAFRDFVEHDRLDKLGEGQHVPEDHEQEQDHSLLDAFSPEIQTEIVSAAELAADQMLHDGTPHRIYVLDNFPQTLDQILPWLEPNHMTKSYASLIDGVLTLVSNQGRPVHARRSCRMAVSKDRQSTTEFQELPRTNVQSQKSDQAQVIDSEIKNSLVEANPQEEQEDIKDNEEEAEENEAESDVNEISALNLKDLQEHPDEPDVAYEGIRSYDVPLHPMNAAVSSFYRAQILGGLKWADFTFDEVSCDSRPTSEAAQSTTCARRSVSNVLSEFHQVLADLSLDKCLFKQWVETTHLRSVPSEPLDEMPFKSQNRQRRRLYQKFLEPVYETSLRPATIVFALREAVATFAGEAVSDAELQRHHQVHHNPCAVAKVNASDAIRMSQARSLLHYRHHSNHFNSTGQVESIRGIYIHELEQEMYNQMDLVGVAHEGRKGLPSEPLMSECQRGIDATEIQSFSPDMDMDMIRYIEQVLEIERILEKHDPQGKWTGKIQSRTHCETLTRTTLPQRLAQVLSEIPEIYQSYFSATDTLLLIAHVPTAHRRYGKQLWCARHGIRHRPAFRDWRLERVNPAFFPTPRLVQHSMRSGVNLSTAECDVVQERTHRLFPADGSTIYVSETPYSGTWLTVRKFPFEFGLRPQDDSPGSEIHFPTCFRANIEHDIQVVVTACLDIESMDEQKHEPPVMIEETGEECGLAKESDEQPKSLVVTNEDDDQDNDDVNESQDNTTLKEEEEPTKEKQEDTCVNPPAPGTAKKTLRRKTIKPDGHGLIVMTHTFPSGLVLSCRSDGRITQAFVTDGRHVNAELAREKSRTILSQGSVVKTFVNGDQEILYADGQVSYRTRDGSDFTPSDIMELTTEVDAVTRAHIQYRTLSNDHKVLTIVYPNGERLTRHQDGTEIVSSGLQVLVQRSGFAQVSINVEVDAVARRHARGEKVAVTQGGIRTRASVRVPNSVRIDIQYDTRVIAQVNGILKSHHQDQTSIEANDAGQVCFHTTSNSSGVYTFQCASGQLTTCDPEHNAFCITLPKDGSQGSECLVEVDLAGEISVEAAARAGVAPITSQAVVNAPRAPNVFLLHGNGSGLEILSEETLHQIRTQYHQEEPNLESTTLSDRGHRQTYVQHVQWPWTYVASSSKKKMKNGEEEEITKHHAMERIFDLPATVQHVLGETPARQTSNNQMVDFPYLNFRVLTKPPAITPSRISRVHEVLENCHKWKQERQESQAFCEVYDPRTEDQIEGERTVQKRIATVIQAKKAKRKMERQKTKDARMHLKGNLPHKVMDALDEDTPFEQPEQQPSNHSEDEELDDSESDSGDSRGDSEAGAVLDDAFELSCTAFADADTEERGRLSLLQTRMALVTTLGTGVSKHELVQVLQDLDEDPEDSITFETYSRILNILKEPSEQEDVQEPGMLEVDSLSGPHAKMKKKQLSQYAAGSGVDAVRAASASSFSDPFQ